MTTLTRRTLLKYAAIGSAALFLPKAVPMSASATSGLEKYLEAVPLPGTGSWSPLQSRTEPVLVHPDANRTTVAPALPPTPL